MTDITAIATKLAALIAEDTVFTDDGARVISQGGAPPAMVALLREVDNTVLERTLVFDFGGAQVSVVVAGRRLRGIVEVAGDVANADAIVGHPLSREDAGTVQAAGDMLISLCEAAGKVTVRSGPPRAIGSSGDAGISASGLTALWHVDVDTTPPPPMERFLTANAQTITGLVHARDGAVIGAAGDSDALQSIWDDQITAFRKRHKTMHARQDGPMLICLNDAIAGQTSAALALIDNEACIFSYDADQLPDVLRSWYTIAG